ncbi:MAG TPA: phytanoyl-CoA dioxygenase family protein [Thermoanaerobaculia bacterium]|nr:phytanoyl-CoA dioxygenase family protein [Thermoanaerobaculia bacterium]
MKQQLDDVGFCVVEDFLTSTEVAELRAATRRYPHELKERPSADCVVTWEGGDRIQQIMHAETLCPKLDQINRSSKSLDLLRQVYGYDIGLYHSKLVLKDSGSGEVPWHQDYAYWCQWSESPCQINCMVYLDDADAENGCLEVIPGSHHQGLVDHRSSSRHGAFGTTLRGIDPSDATAIVGRVGTAIFFSPLLFHGSRANHSMRPRHSFTTVYTNPLLDVHREVYGRFFPTDRVKALTGKGPFNFCPENYQRRNLWQLAAAHVGRCDWNWIEITDRTFSDGSFEWLSARKDPRSVYHRYEEHPLVASNRDDVKVHAGRLRDRLSDLQGPFGLVFLDCDLTVNAHAAWHALLPELRDGTIVVIDRFYDYPGWERGGYSAFHEVVVDRQLGFDYLGRSPQQVALRITEGAPCRCPPVDWQPVSSGIVFG